MPATANPTAHWVIFELMTVIDAMNPSAWRTLATIQLSVDKNPEAISSAEKALELGIPAEEEPLCHLVKAIANRRLGNVSDGEKSAALFFNRAKNRKEEPDGSLFASIAKLRLRLASIR
jgi:hypothetical protein